VWAGRDLAFELAPLEPWLDRLASLPEVWNQPPLLQFIAIHNGPRQVPGQGGPWGCETSMGGWGTAVERRGLRESVFHAFLHLLGVDDGYDPASKKTRPDCTEDCWMQYVPTRGDRLCNKHLQQLTDYVEASVST
jgi:hypothetical protein